MPDSYKLKVKICLAGDSAVGKTSLVRRYVMDIFDDSYISTLGTKISKKRIIVKKVDQNFNLTLSIWDVLGQQKLIASQAMAFEGAKGYMVVCDFTRKETLENIEKWIANIKKVTGDIPGLILVNKSDQTNQYQIAEDDIKEISLKYNIPYFITSAKEGDNVISPFFTIGKLIIEKIFGNT